MKPIEFVGTALDDLRAFPESARREAGYQMDRVQHDEMPGDWKPMTSIGAGVKEIRIRDASGAFRVIYLAKMAEAVYVLHCFQKKSEQTSETDIRLARKRLKELMEDKS